MAKLTKHKDQDNKHRAFQFISSLIDYEFDNPNAIDNLKEWKLENQVNIILKTIEYFNTAQVQPQRIKIKEITKFLDYCSYESKDTVQFKWAALLANSLVNIEETISMTVFSELLNQLSENEICILEYLYDESFIESSSQKAELTKLTITKHLHIDLKLGEILFENLNRLNLIAFLNKQKQSVAISDPYFGEQPTNKELEKLIALSNLGQYFVQQINFEL